MEFMWSREFSLKNIQLDKQHDLIFEIATISNDLTQKIKNNQLQYKDDLKQIIIKLFQYIKIHFKDEEKFMESIDFPMLEEHKKSHRNLMQKSKELLNYSNDIIKISEELSTLINGWIFDHLVNEDLWIVNFTSKALHLKEIHYTLDQYIKLKSIKQDLTTEKTYDYVCNCPLYIHTVPEIIHQELINKENDLKCSKCGQILVYLDSFDLEQNFEKLNHIFEDITKDYKFATIKNNNNE
ncbi:hemerythrin domain-containing protein [Campylobacter jejuni]|nr:hemerythrin domain-containing protein [Campylobacter jejuni]EHN6915954.1 hemerythrin domain-containing protein [Campylobacter jejuni]